MAYSRFGESNIYVFMTPDKEFICCACKLIDNDYTTKSGKKMAAHLREHEAAGDDCDYDQVIAEILADACENRATRNLEPTHA